MARWGRCLVGEDDVNSLAGGLRETEPSSAALERARLAADVPQRHTSPHRAHCRDGEADLQVRRQKPPKRGALCATYKLLNEARNAPRPIPYASERWIAAG